jgi:hypothetical protein
MLKGQLDEPNSIHTVDDFLDGSLSDAEGITYGTRVEHIGPKSLRDYLEEENLLTVFLNITYTLCYKTLFIWKSNFIGTEVLLELITV